MWYYYEILEKITLETTGSDKVWASSKDQAQAIANSRAEAEAGYVASEVTPLS